MDFFFPKFQYNHRLCPVDTLCAYERRTEGLQTEIASNQHKLLLSAVKPHKAVAPSTVARWLRTTLEKAGIDLSIFKAHSTRGASTLAAARTGIITADIMSAADWSSESVFQKNRSLTKISPLQKYAHLSLVPCFSSTRALYL